MCLVHTGVSGGNNSFPFSSWNSLDGTTFPLGNFLSKPSAIRKNFSCVQ